MMTTDRRRHGQSSVAGRVQRTLRVLVLFAAVVTGLFALFFWPATVIPAIVLAFLYVLLMVANVATRRAEGGTVTAVATPTAAPAASNDAEDRELEQQQRVRNVKQREGIRLALGIIAALAVIAVILAAVVLDWRLVAIGAIVVFCYLALLGGPYWVAAIEEEADLTHERLTGEQRAIH